MERALTLAAPCGGHSPAVSQLCHFTSLSLTSIICQMGTTIGMLGRWNILTVMEHLSCVRPC